MWYGQVGSGFATQFAGHPCGAKGPSGAPTNANATATAAMVFSIICPFDSFQVTGVWA